MRVVQTITTFYSAATHIKVTSNRHLSRTNDAHHQNYCRMLNKLAKSERSMDESILSYSNLWYSIWNDCEKPFSIQLAALRPKSGFEIVWLRCLLKLAMIRHIVMIFREVIASPTQLDTIENDEKHWSGREKKFHGNYWQAVNMWHLPALPSLMLHLFIGTKISSNEK